MSHLFHVVYSTFALALTLQNFVISGLFHLGWLLYTSAKNDIYSANNALQRCAEESLYVCTDLSENVLYIHSVLMDIAPFQFSDPHKKQGSAWSFPMGDQRQRAQ